MADLGPGSDARYWQKLPDKLERRERLVQYLSLLSCKMEVPAQDPVPSPSIKRVSSLNQRHPAESDENKCSLNRISYLGGVLQPMSVVLDVLAMGETFGPGDDMFYVFWAAAVPLTIFTLLPIYGDSIRKVEVRIEEAQSNHGANGLVDIGRPETRGGLPPPPDLEQAVDCSYTQSIAIGNRTANPVAIAMPGPSRTSEPATTAGRRHGEEKRKVWKKEELGWLGACKAILRIYRLQNM